MCEENDTASATQPVEVISQPAMVEPEPEPEPQPNQDLYPAYDTEHLHDVLF
ncbi:hypothetical protein [Acinetobacter baumannii]|uniref:hypothetical protein n=1 Tax=Acinetobacter baumannii TaxID=470 RepID=UPI00148C197C|nr:hypothetical protein [Acinetobacter baumannii]